MALRYHPAMFIYPDFDPVALSIGPLSVRWYGLMYLLGFGLFLFLGRHRARHEPRWGVTPDQVDDLLFYGVIGVVIGGRLGYILFYRAGDYLAEPRAILRVWEGGMSFHGGLIGVVLAVMWMAHSQKITLSALADSVAVATPIGLGLGRIANFINAELYGRVSDAPWAMRFPIYDAHFQVAAYTEPRHPSQLYQAFLEGLVLFLVLRVATHRFKALQRPWLATGVFLAGYALVRMAAEFVRQPDPGLDNLPFGLTMGMILSAPMLAIGAWLIARALKRPPVAA